jgi:DNA polymerase III subunit delta'
MADEVDDPREVPWHPRFARGLVGREKELRLIISALAAGKPHHAWLLHGPSGIGKATLAYAAAIEVLGVTHKETARKWIEARAHPDLHVLERTFGETKPRKLRNEIVIADARRFMERFDQTASGDGYRVGIIDCMDELTHESANALLKLIEEPPERTLFFLVCHQLGQVLRTVQSRCIKLPVEPLSSADTTQVLENLPLPKQPMSGDLQLAVGLSKGRPGRALALLGSNGAAAFAAFRQATTNNLRSKTDVLNHMGSSKSVKDDYRILMELMLEWLAPEARLYAGSAKGKALAEAFAKLQDTQAMTEAFNLDRKTAVLDHLSVLEDALKAA